MEALEVKLIPTKQLFYNESNGYRILSCRPTEDYEKLELSNYGTFTISGSDIVSLELNTEYYLKIRKDEKSKYPASYVMISFAGIEVGEEVTVDPAYHYNFLCQFMEPSIARSIDETCPDFTKLILEGHEEEIDYKPIKGVGPVRFESYVAKVKAHCGNLKYFPVCGEWGIIDENQINKLASLYGSPENLKEKLEENPYNIFFNILEMSFNKSDRIVLEHRPDLKRSKERAELGLLEILKQNELEGDTRINYDLVLELAEEIVPECKDLLENIAINSEKIYYNAQTGYMSNQSTYDAEAEIAEELLNRINNPERIGMDWEKFRKVDGFECTDEQAEILKLADEQKVCMLRGFSGSGKSTVMKALVLMLEHYNKDYVMLAPTGKASARLRETTGRDASTIHMLLAQLMRDKDNINIITPDYVIVDEMSMVGVHLLANLFKVISFKTRFIFICDEAQLASISCGNVVQDIIDSGVMPTASLTKIFRYNTSGLATVATDTRNGELGPRTKDNKFDDYEFYEGTDPIKQIVELYGDLLNQGYKKDDILILCPYNKTENGTYRINAEIQKQFNNHSGLKASYEIKGYGRIVFKVGDKVINTKNNYRMPSVGYEDGAMVESPRRFAVMNGDIGVVRRIEETKTGYVMAVEFDNGTAYVEKEAITKLLLGYAITIHKAQGSQARVVIVYTSKAHKRMISRNLLYVADSRAQEKLIEIGDIEAIQAGLEVEENKERDTFLKEMLINP